MKLRSIPALALLVGLVFSTASLAADVRVSAAASLADAMQEIAAAYEKQSGDKIVFNLGASNTLARQIEEGAPADIFFSADEAKMDALAKKGLILPETRQSLLSNTLVIVVTTDSALAIHKAPDLAAPAVKRLALAETKTVPAGIYAREYLEKLGLWAAMEPRVMPAESVRAALAAVESGNVEAGIVYKTDALISKKVKVALEISAADGPKISYPLAVVKDSKQPEAAKKFAEHLAGPAARAIFDKFGFGAVK